MPTRIYHPHALLLAQPTCLVDNSAHHVAHVLRMRRGESLTLFNGDGHEYLGVIEEINKKHVIVRLIECVHRSCESPLSLHLGQALTRGEKMDWIIQKAVELGVMAITPLWTQHTAVHYSAAQIAKKMMRWQNIIISACEQCGRNVLPHLFPPLAVTTWLQSAAKGTGLLLAPGAATALKDLPKPVTGEIYLGIGPEGGWHTEELQQAQARQFHLLHLGTRILRMETAALAAISVVQFQWGDMG